MVGQPGVGFAVVSFGSALSASLHAAASLPRDVSVELPFVLMHPKPHDHIITPRPQSGERATDPKPPKGGPETRPMEKSWCFLQPPTHPLSSSL